MTHAPCPTRAPGKSGALGWKKVIDASDASLLHVEQGEKSEASSTFFHYGATCVVFSYLGFGRGGDILSTAIRERPYMMSASEGGRGVMEKRT